MKLIKRFVCELQSDCYILGFSELVGEKEKHGVFGKYFHDSVSDDKLGEKTFEKGARLMLERVCNKAIEKSAIDRCDIELFLGGDLMNQLVSTNYVAEHLQIPFVGIYSACSTLTSSLGVGCLLIESGYSNILCSAISHFSSAERQYRYPLEFGNQRQCYSQWTVTAGAAFVISNKKSDLKIKLFSLFLNE